MPEQAALVRKPSSHWSNAMAKSRLLHHVPSVNAAKTLRPLLEKHIHAETKFIMATKAARALEFSSQFKNHGTINHSIGEYVAATCIRTQLKATSQSLNAASLVYTIMSAKNI